MFVSAHVPQWLVSGWKGRRNCGTGWRGFGYYSHSFSRRGQHLRRVIFHSLDRNRNEFPRAVSSTKFWVVICCLFQSHMPYFRRRMVYEIITKKLLWVALRLSSSCQKLRQSMLFILRILLVYLHLILVVQTTLYHQRLFDSFVKKSIKIVLLRVIWISCVCFFKNNSRVLYGNCGRLYCNSSRFECKH